MDDTPKTLRSGRYAIVRVLGEGGQASTFEAVDKRRGALVAVKRFRVRGAKSWKEVELAEREARVLSSIDHPRLPRYVEHFEEKGELYLVTDKIEGKSLLEIRKAGGSLAEAEVVRLLHDASEALEYLHGRAPPVIHRDIKPSNVIRRTDGSFSLIDFGAVRDKLKPEGGSTVVGTFGYMAPEQFQGRALPASDVYALGATALTLLTGTEPEDLPHKGLAVDVATALRGRSTSPALVRAITAMLEPDPDRRPSRIGPLLAEIDRATAGSRKKAARAAAPGPSLRDGDALTEHFVKSAIERSRRERKRDERERRRAEREGEREQRRALRSAMRAGGHRGPGFAGLPWPVLFVLVLGLTIAQVAVTLALRVAVPILFAILSVVFGKGMREAGRTVASAGKIAGDAIQRAKGTVSGRPATDDPRLRVEEVLEVEAHARIVDDTAGQEAEDELAAEEEAEEPRGRERRG